MSRMALRRAAFNSASEPRPLAPTGAVAAGPASSGSLHSGQRLAKPGLPGLSSNSSPQATQTLIGKGITEIFYRHRTASVGGRGVRVVLPPDRAWLPKRNERGFSSHLQLAKVRNAGLHQRQVHFHEVILYAADLCRAKNSRPIESALANRDNFATGRRPALNVHGNEAARVPGEVLCGV